MEPLAIETKKLNKEDRFYLYSLNNCTASIKDFKFLVWYDWEAILCDKLDYTNLTEDREEFINHVRKAINLA